jgi:hypothetical protein
LKTPRNQSDTTCMKSQLTSCPHRARTLQAEPPPRRLVDACAPW